eukprot:scaffold5164_cov102-Isochrysis_galbana.AAC.2
MGRGRESDRTAMDRGQSNPATAAHAARAGIPPRTPHLARAAVSDGRRRRLARACPVQARGARMPSDVGERRGERTHPEVGGRPRIIGGGSRVGGSDVYEELAVLAGDGPGERWAGGAVTSREMRVCGGGHLVPRDARVIVDVSGAEARLGVGVAWDERLEGRAQGARLEPQARVEDLEEGGGGRCSTGAARGPPLGIEALDIAPPLVLPVRKEEDTGVGNGYKWVVLVGRGVRACGWRIGRWGF